MNFLGEVFSKISFLNIPHLGINDVIDIIGVAYLIYKVISWIKDTRAWSLFKGVGVVILLALIANIFDLHTIWWILSNSLPVGAIGMVVIFQPELRRALEQIGRGKILSSIAGLESERTGSALKEETVNALIRAIFKMAQVRTGALIVIEKDTKLGDVERTGIIIDAVVSSQLLINIFEDKTPLHDGAVIISNNRISAATCFLPLTDSQEVSKALGTRHRAAIGISEISDAIVIVVSEETGTVSVVHNGNMDRGVDTEALKRKLIRINTGKNKIETRLRFWKGWNKNE
ncbi:MAG TPA: TIGR00159 family protein [Epulopiscium sp.]|nr:TIGR00159 family protein [Candidatus Epulonipiscium sp.]